MEITWTKIHNLKKLQTEKNKRISDETKKGARWRVNLNPTIKIITLNANSLNMLLRTIRLDKKATPNFRSCL